MQYRHEWKHEINYADMLPLRSRLRAVMKYDKHTENGIYKIRSLYLDSPGDKALREKIDGVNMREKFRLRLYNGDTSFICLEKKSKLNGLTSKESCIISKDEAQMTVNGEIDWMIKSERALCAELYSKMKSQGLRPKTIVDYTREAYVYAPGNVRVTIDSDIRCGEYRTDFLNPDTITVPAGNSPIILEVKWDNYLPDIIRDAASVPNRRANAFSKYAHCRIFG